PAPPSNPDRNSQVLSRQALAASVLDAARGLHSSPAHARAQSVSARRPSPGSDNRGTSLGRTDRPVDAAVGADLPGAIRRLVGPAAAPHGHGGDEAPAARPGPPPLSGTTRGNPSFAASAGAISSTARGPHPVGAPAPGTHGGSTMAKTTPPLADLAARAKS